MDIFWNTTNKESKGTYLRWQQVEYHVDNVIDMSYDIISYCLPQTIHFLQGFFGKGSLSRSTPKYELISNISQKAFSKSEKLRRCEYSTVFHSNL